MVIDNCLVVIRLYDPLLSNCISYCTESARNEHKYTTILHSRLLYGWLCNISNTRKSVSSGYPNPEKWV